MLTPFRKHILTHTRPFKCLVGNCAQTPSCFATDNDLKRHQKSCHGMASTHCPAYYKCQIPHCPKAGKLHDRRDNFMGHISRTHIQKDNKPRANHHILPGNEKDWVERSVSRFLFANTFTDNLSQLRMSPHAGRTGSPPSGKTRKIPWYRF